MEKSHGKVEEITVIDMDKEKNDNQKGSLRSAAAPPMIDPDLNGDIKIEQIESCAIVCEGSEEFEDPLELSPSPLSTDEEMQVADISDAQMPPTTPAAHSSSSVVYFCGLCSGDVSTTYKTQKELEEHSKMAHQPTPRFAPSISRCYPPAKRTGTFVHKPPMGTTQSSTSIVSSSPNKKAKIQKEEKKGPRQRQSSGNIDDCVFSYDCPNCPHIVNYGINAYAQHLSIHMRRPYQCTFCLELLPEEQSTWEEHWRTKHSGIKHDSLRFLKVHFDPGLIFKCDGCKIGFKSQKERNRHEVTCPQKKAKSNSLKASVTSPNSSNRTCLTCQKVLRNRDEWRLHRLLLHPEVDRLSCYSCDETFGEGRLDCGAEVVIESNDEKLEKHICFKIPSQFDDKNICPELKEGLETTAHERLEDAANNIRNNYDARQMQNPYGGATRTTTSPVNRRTSTAVTEVVHPRNKSLNMKYLTFLGFVLLVGFYYNVSSLASFTLSPSLKVETILSGPHLSVDESSTSSYIVQNKTNSSELITLKVKSTFGKIFDFNITSGDNVKALVDKVKKEKNIPFQFYFTHCGKSLQNSSSVSSIHLKENEYLQITPRRKTKKLIINNN